jgi:peptidoglycan/LPS O-acetylase OafA/YrhL
MPQRAPAPRLVFLDNLRTAMIFLVVLYHAGIVYESSGLFASFWIVDDPATNPVVGIVNVVIDIIVMAAIFFVSGYLAPVSLSRHDAWAFLSQRFRRLIVPWLVAVLTLVPLYKVIFLASRGLPQEHWTTYFHFSNGDLSQGWLWFLPVLFLFDAIVAGFAKAGIRAPAVSLRTSVVLLFLIGVLSSFALSVVGLTGWTKTALFDFQNERLLMYFMVFLLGAQCFRLGIFDRPPARTRSFIAVAATAWIPINVYLVVLLSLLLRPGEYIVSLTADLLVLWCAFYLSLLALLYLTVATFRRWFNVQGRLGASLARGSYAVYILHVPILGVIALLLLGTGVPSLVKYGILAASTYVVSNLIALAYQAVRGRAVPGIPVSDISWTRPL